MQAPTKRTYPKQTVLPVEPQKKTMKTKRSKSRRDDKRSKQQKLESDSSENDGSDSSSSSDGYNSDGTTPIVHLASLADNEPARWKNKQFFGGGDSHWINNIRVKGAFDESKAMNMVYLMKKKPKNMKNVTNTYMELTSCEAEEVMQAVDKLCELIAATPYKETLALLENSPYGRIEDIKDENYWDSSICVVIDQLKIRPARMQGGQYLIRIHSHASQKTIDNFGWIGPLISVQIGEGKILVNVLKTILDGFAVTERNSLCSAENPIENLVGKGGSNKIELSEDTTT